jgi:hypothetical protein
MSKNLENVLADKLAEASIHGTIQNLQPLTGGASKEIWKIRSKV